MDHVLFKTLLNHLLNVNVVFPSASKDALEEFQKKFCYHENFQPLFTASVLKQMMQDMDVQTVYELRDPLGLCILALRLEGEKVIVGPFALKEFQEEKVRSVMLSQGLPLSFLESLRLYFSAFPVISANHAFRTVSACAGSFAGISDDFQLCRIDHYKASEKLPKTIYQEALDYSSVYHRYEAENQFLRLIETGDVENVLISYSRMSAVNMNADRYVSAVYQDVSVSLSMVRALARKAAENGGASVVQIHEITQRGVQRFLAARTVLEKESQTRAMILELTEAVREARNRNLQYSSPVRKAVEYIRLNYSQEISLEMLSAHVSLSESHLSHLFKKEVGLSVVEYIVRLRCEKAAELLRGTSDSVQDISACVGYLDSSYFVRVFKKRYGITPTAYRTNPSN